MGVAAGIVTVAVAEASGTPKCVTEFGPGDDVEVGTGVTVAVAAGLEVATSVGPGETVAVIAGTGVAAGEEVVTTEGGVGVTVAAMAVVGEPTSWTSSPTAATRESRPLRLGKARRPCRRPARLTNGIAAETYRVSRPTENDVGISPYAASQALESRSRGSTMPAGYMRRQCFAVNTHKTCSGVGVSVVQGMPTPSENGWAPKFPMLSRRGSVAVRLYGVVGKVHQFVALA